MNDLTPDYWKRIDTLLEQVLDREKDIRYSYLREICGTDTTLFNSIDTLLRLHDEAEIILGESAATYAAPLIPGLIDEFDRSRGYSEESDLQPGARLDRYEIISIAGRGGMGTVYRAARADDTYKKEVALKLVRRGMDTSDILRRFRYEQQILASLEHPGIACLYDAGASEDGRPFFVMEFVDGIPVDLYCDEHGLTVRERIELFLTICRAVSYAHQKLVVHRDLKPSNILVTTGGGVKLLDFGIAKLLDDNSDNLTALLTRPGAHLLTPRYAAPEQLNSGQVSTATDVFSLGVVLYELLTGRRAFIREKNRETSPARPDEIPLPSRNDLPPAVIGVSSGRVAGELSAFDVSETIAGTRKTTPAILHRTLSGDLDNILLKALHPESESRYASPDLLADDLRRYLDGMPVSARPFETGYRISKFIGRHKTGVGIAALAILVLFMFTLGLIHLQAETALERDIATIERNKAAEVAAFLEELLSSANPYYGTTRADTLRLRDFVQLSADKVRFELNSQPAVKARMLNVLGHMHGKLNMSEEALSLLEEALSLRISLYGEDHEEVSETLNDLGIIHHQLGDYEKAEQLLRSSLEQRQTAGISEMLSDSYTSLANLINDMGNYDLAEEYYREALIIRESIYGPDHQKTALALLNMATILQRKGDLDGAETYHLRTLAINREYLGSEHPAVANSENNLGLLYADRGQNDLAEELLRSALVSRIKIFGNEHPQVASSMNNLATVLNDVGNYEEAEHYFRMSLDLRRKLYGENSMQVAVGMNNLASLLRRVDRLDEAVEMNIESVGVAVAVLGGEHPSIGILNGNLASMLRQKGDVLQAERLYRESLALLEKTLPSDHPSIARQKVGLAECLTDLNRFEEAEVLMLSGYRMFVDKGIDAGTTLQSLVRLYELWDKPEEAFRFSELMTE
jgi:eukaryotic-like serine/threonine-protein kinase